MSNSIFSKIANAVGGKKGRFITLAIWILLVIALQLFLPKAADYKDDAAPDLAASEPSVVAQKVMDEQFPSGEGTPALITWYRSTGLTNADLAQIQQFSKELEQNPIKHQKTAVPYDKMPLPVLKQQVSEDGTTFIQTVLMDSSATSDQLKDSFTELEKTANATFSDKPFKQDVASKDTLVARTTGPAGISVDATELFSDADVSLLIGTVLLVLVFLLVIYRSPILALIPLIAVGFAYLAVTPILGLLGQEGIITYGSQGLSIMTVLLFGAGTDYCLFLIARFRSQLHHDENRYTAFKKAFGNTAGAIALSGFTVMAALLILLVAKYGSIHNFAVPFSLSILIMMISSLTLVPALLGIFGRISFWPFVPRTEAMAKEHAAKKGKKVKIHRENRFWHRVGEISAHHPIKTFVITLLILGGCALFATQVKYTYDTLSTFPKDMPSREGFTLISDHFGAGQLAPMNLIVKTNGEKTAMRENLQKTDGIETVSVGVPSTKNRDYTMYTIQLADNPYSNAAMDLIPDIRDTAQTTMSDAGLSKNNVWIAGQTATQYDSRAVTKDDEALIIPLVIGLIALLLLAYLRSITAMVYLVATVLLSFFSALGLGWVIIHYIMGTEAIAGLIPIYAFVFIVALGEDYNIFMISSIWKKSRELPLREAIAEGVGQTGGVITSAGLILAGTFAVLTTLPIQLLVQFGLITAIGVLLDTFIVRPFLVPAITMLFGKWAFWPGKGHNQEHK
ncbi:MMPL family transporter [Listeria booriae]|uniref:MMPL family transporter n=1 Tax=Listeria booriae TaxID=1552123 RepID=A0A842EXN4_9LIST|nr:MMPL family transporter [Listeria booriae]MBC2057232.1 MMPL family transporter [Listeria booriae]MBC2180318.1 MMPL family transporter [Listeria booriae]MBC2241414.1 MMPL family transporter [Listeria booriae]MBC2244578.1 MMPL family transporter [Listeria booriae]